MDTTTMFAAANNIVLQEILAGLTAIRDRQKDETNGGSGNGRSSEDILVNWEAIRRKGI